MALKKTLKASTLVETLVAMVIITLTLGFGATTYVKVMQSADQERKMKAELILNEWKIIRINAEKDESFIKEGIRYEKRFLPYGETIGIKVMELSATAEDGTMIARHKELIQDIQ
jgi:hypothetical protein